jgi:hypothetical protein
MLNHYALRGSLAGNPTGIPGGVSASLQAPCGQPFLGLSLELDVREGGHGTNFLVSIF